MLMGFLQSILIGRSIQPCLLPCTGMYWNVLQEPRQYSLRKGEVGRLQEAVAAAAAAGSPAR